MGIKDKIQKKEPQSSSSYNLSDHLSQEESVPQDCCYIKQERKIREKIRKSTALKKKNHGSWTPSQEKKFIEFMKKKRPIFQDKELRRTHKIFKQMARFLKSRSSEQCRSHHQKYEIKLKLFDSIIAYVEGKIIDMEYLHHVDKDSNYEFFNQADCEWQNNPVYAEKVKNKQKSFPESFEFALVNKLDFKTEKQHLSPNIQSDHEIIAQSEGEWKLFSNKLNNFTIKISFDSFM